LPQYEYECLEDGERITLLRPMREADDPVEDPAGRGRTFQRVFSTFDVGESRSGNAAPSFGGGCGHCGDPHGPCGMA
jgi:predicted nucleic acid-binding Zn ribbon protein